MDMDFLKLLFIPQISWSQLPMQNGESARSKEHREHISTGSLSLITLFHRISLSLIWGGWGWGERRQNPVTLRIHTISIKGNSCSYTSKLAKTSSTPEVLVLVKATAYHSLTYLLIYTFFLKKGYGHVIIFQSQIILPLFIHPAPCVFASLKP